MSIKVVSIGAVGTKVAYEFPVIIIVAATISLAGLTPDKTSMGVCVGPFLTRNTHVVEIPLDSSNVSMHIHNKPSTKNPTTSIMTSQSVIALLSHFHSILHIGT